MFSDKIIKAVSKISVVQIKTENFRRKIRSGIVMFLMYCTPFAFISNFVELFTTLMINLHTKYVKHIPKNAVFN